MAVLVFGLVCTATTFLVTQLTGPHALRIAYAVPATGPGGTFVALAEQPLPASRRISVPADSPLSQLNLAIYLGRPPLVGDGTDAGYPPVKPAAPIGMPERSAPEPIVVAVPARGLLIAYTDGLIERRHETLDAGMKRLADAARQESSLDEMLDSIMVCPR